jgi:hypothetical protein
MRTRTALVTVAGALGYLALWDNWRVVGPALTHFSNEHIYCLKMGDVVVGCGIIGLLSWKEENAARLIGGIVQVASLLVATALSFVVLFNLADLIDQSTLWGGIGVGLVAWLAYVYLWPKHWWPRKEWLSK